MHVCVWYTELTCISNGASKTDIVVGKVQYVSVCVLTDGGATPVAGRQGPTICIMCASGGATPFAGRP